MYILPSLYYLVEYFTFSKLLTQMSLIQTLELARGKVDRWNDPEVVFVFVYELRANFSLLCSYLASPSWGYATKYNSLSSNSSS